jgi:hypothetical protein
VTFDPNQPTPREPLIPAAPEPSGVPGIPAGPGVPTSPVVPSSVGAAPAPIVVAKKTGSGGRLLNIVLAAAVAVAIGGVAFAVGRSTAPVSAATGGRGGNFGGVFPGGSFAPRASGQPGFGRGGGGFGGAAGAGLTVSGTVVSVTGDTLTIKTAAGQTIEVTTGTSTTYDTQTPATAADVQAGKTVQVQLTFAGGGAGRPNASSAPTGPVGTADSVTVVP